MTWLGWLLAIDIGLSALWKITQVGVRRKPVTRAEAVGYVVVAVLYIWGITTIGTLR